MNEGGAVEIQELELSCTLRADHPHASQVKDVPIIQGSHLMILWLGAVFLDPPLNVNLDASF